MPGAVVGFGVGLGFAVGPGLAEAAREALGASVGRAVGVGFAAAREADAPAAKRRVGSAARPRRRGARDEQHDEGHDHQRDEGDLAAGADRRPGEAREAALGLDDEQLRSRRRPEVGIVVAGTGLGHGVRDARQGGAIGRAPGVRGDQAQVPLLVAREEHRRVDGAAALVADRVGALPAAVAGHEVRADRAQRRRRGLGFGADVDAVAAGRRAGGVTGDGHAPRG